MTRTVWYRVHCDTHQQRIVPGGSLLRWLDEHNECNGRFADDESAHAAASALRRALLRVEWMTNDMEAL